MESIARQSQEIADVRRKIDAWRQQKRHAGEAMPASLWQAAVQLTATDSLLAVARGLGVDYGKLKRLVREWKSHGSSAMVTTSREADATAEFVELGELFGGCRAAVVEMRRNGASLRVELPEARVDLVELTASFFRGAV